MQLTAAGAQINTHSLQTETEEAVMPAKRMMNKADRAPRK